MKIKNKHTNKTIMITTINKFRKINENANSIEIAIQEPEVSKIISVLYDRITVVNPEIEKDYHMFIAADQAMCEIADMFIDSDGIQTGEIEPGKFVYTLLQADFDYDNEAGKYLFGSDLDVNSFVEKLVKDITVGKCDSEIAEYTNESFNKSKVNETFNNGLQTTQIKTGVDYFYSVQVNFDKPLTKESKKAIKVAVDSLDGDLRFINAGYSISYSGPTAKAVQPIINIISKLDL